MKKAVMYGAGNIGRGFIGKVFSESGYQVCFLDIDEVVIQALCSKGSYTVLTVSNSNKWDTIVNHVYGVNANSEQAIAEISACDIMATSVGVNILPKIAPNLALGIKRRIKSHNAPLNILLAENQLQVDHLMRELIYQELDPTEQEWADENLGLVEVSIGRMIPPLTPAEKEKDPLLIAVEPYCALPADALGFKGGIPDLVGLLPFTPFDFYVKRKLFLHNMGHAICAYLGFEKGYTHIAEAIEDSAIQAKVSRAMEQVVQALHHEYPQIPLAEIDANRKDLLERFGNIALKDTIMRVAGDPKRKLRSNDRLVGAAQYCLQQGISADAIVSGIIAAYGYDNPDDPSSGEIQQLISSCGMSEALRVISGIEKDSKLGRMILYANQ